MIITISKLWRRKQPVAPPIPPEHIALVSHWWEHMTRLERDRALAKSGVLKGTGNQPDLWKQDFGLFATDQQNQLTRVIMPWILSAQNTWESLGPNKIERQRIAVATGFNIDLIMAYPWSAFCIYEQVTIWRTLYEKFSTEVYVEYK